MAWDTDSTPISNPQFRGLRNRLLLSYLVLVAIISGSFAAVVYGVVARDRNIQLNDHIQQIAESAASTLEIIRHEYTELATEAEHQGSLARQSDGNLQPITLSTLMGEYEANSILDVDTASLSVGHQGVEWFSAQGHLMVREGLVFPETPLPLAPPADGIRTQQAWLRSFVLPIYHKVPNGSLQLLGYVRATESTETLESELRRLRWGLGLGGVVVAGLTTLSAFWLTQESLKPVLESYTQLRQFTSDASHELRNPLTAIRASVAVMQNHPERVHPADLEKMGAIASASQQMSQLVDNLLLLARMDRQRAEPRAWRVLALDEMLEDLVELYGDRATQAGIDLKASLLPQTHVQGDATQLQCLFTNLLANALQYTPQGGSVCLSMQLASHSVIVKVEDTGIGIAPEHLSRIFDRFWRADPARQWHTGGSGLGLAIARAIAQYHGGTLTVQSQMGKGSCFQTRLPLA